MGRLVQSLLTISKAVTPAKAGVTRGYDERMRTVIIESRSYVKLCNIDQRMLS